MDREMMIPSRCLCTYLCVHVAEESAEPEMHRNKPSRTRTDYSAFDLL